MSQTPKSSSENSFSKKKPLAVIVGIKENSHDVQKVYDSLDELGLLLKTLGVDVCGRVIQN